MPLAETYTCAGCRRVFRLGDPDRAAAEAVRTCVGVDPEDCAIVCDACFHEIWFGMFGIKPPGVVLH